MCTDDRTEDGVGSGKIKFLHCKLRAPLDLPAGSNETAWLPAHAERKPTHMGRGACTRGKETFPKPPSSEC